MLLTVVGGESLPCQLVGPDSDLGNHDKSRVGRKALLDSCDRYFGDDAFRYDCHYFLRRVAADAGLTIGNPGSNCLDGDV